jgi:hypothetical protein
MSGYFDEDTLAEAEQGLLDQAHFAKIAFAEGVGGYWNGAGSITGGGVMGYRNDAGVIVPVTYLGDGSLGEISGVSEAEGMASSEVTVVLNSAIDAVRNDFKTKTWHLRRIEVFGLLFNASKRSLYPTPVWRQVGLLEMASTNQASGDQASITLRICDLNQRSKIGSAGYLTDGDQRRRSDTDSILRNVSALGRSTVNSWGKKLYQYGNQSVHGKSISG